MDDSAKQITEWLQKLPTIYFYIACGVIGLVVLALNWGGPGLAGPEEDLVAPPSFAVEIDPPGPPREPTSPTLLSGLGPRGSVGLEMSQVIDELEAYSLRFLSDPNASIPAWVGSDFSGRGLQPESLEERFSDGKISVLRAAKSDEAPTFDGEARFSEFISNAVAELSDAQRRRIDFRIYSSEVENETANIRFLVETHGVRDLPFAQVTRQGYRKMVTQGTTLWETKWQRTDTPTPSAKRYVLLSATVLAKEQVEARLNTDQLLEDCTASVFRGCDRFRDQLAFGLDTWSQYVAGVDIRGHQGVAVGDANGDGLDDLYVCQAHGLPNLLLVQQSDGTVSDQSVGSRTCILDESRAALFLDLDNDGDQDLVVATHDHLVTLSNDGRGVYDLESKLSLARDAQSLAAADFDADGDLDLFVCKWSAAGSQRDVLVLPTSSAPENASAYGGGGRNLLLRNDGGFRWSDATESSGFNVDNQRFSRSAVWIDHDQDGDLDLYVANEFSPDQWYANQDGWFVDVAQSLGIKQPSRHTSVSLGDFNQDGQEDLFVAADVPLAGYRILEGLQAPAGNHNEPLRAMLLSENLIRFGTRGGSDSPFFLKAPVFNSESATTTASADLNNDGLEDVLVGNGGLTRDRQHDLVDALYDRAFGSAASGGGQSSFRLTAHRVTEIANEISDLCRAGYSLSGRQRNRGFLNIGENGFSNASAVLGIDLPDDARSLATTDWDQDGDLDVIATCRTGPQLRIFCNQLNEANSSVSLDLVGTHSNRDAIGARVELYMESRERPLLRIVQAGSGALSQSSKRLVFGLGGAPQIERIVVTWPRGLVQEFEGIEPGKTYRLVEGQDDFELAARSRPLVRIPPWTTERNQALPVPEERTLLYPRLPLPALQYQFDEGRWCQLSESEGDPLLVLFWSGEPESMGLLKELHHQLHLIKKEQAQSVSLLVKPDDPVTDQWRFARQSLASIEFLGEWGTLAGASVDQLELAFGQWFNQQSLPDLPFAILLGPDRKAVAIYHGPDMDFEQVRSDIRLSRKTDWQYRMGARTLDGFWIVDELIARVGRLPQRLESQGYEEAARALQPAERQERALRLGHQAEQLAARAAFEEARELIRDAVALDTERAGLWLQKGKIESAAAASVGPDSPEFQAWNHQAELDLRQALLLDPRSEPAVLALADVYDQAGEADRARLQLESFLTYQPESPRTLARLGRSWLDQGNNDQATVRLTQAYDLQPNLPDLAFDLGRVYLMLGESSFARKFLAHAQRLRPRSPETLRWLADAELANGEMDRATQCLKDLLAERPEDQQAKSRLAWILATSPEVRQRSGSGAMQLLGTPDASSGTSPEELEIRAASLAELGQFAEAVQLQEEAWRQVSQDQDGRYSDRRKHGLQERLEMYRQSRPYRMADWEQSPLAPAAQWR